MTGVQTCALPIYLPSSQAATPSEAPAFVSVAITPDGSLYLGDEKLPPEILQQRLAALGKSNPQMEVQLRADKTVPYGSVAELIGWLQAAGLQRIAFVADAKLPG